MVVLQQEKCLETTIDDSNLHSNNGSKEKKDLQQWRWRRDKAKSEDEDAKKNDNRIECRRQPKLELLLSETNGSGVENNDAKVDDGDVSREEDGESCL